MTINFKNQCMMKIRIFLITLVCVPIIFLGKLNANTTENDLLKVIPPTPASPTVSSLGKYGAWPVSYYRGTPNISIPLGHLQLNDFNLPIDLSYHASGIKVEDIASWVGLGWSLNAGGVINISVNGRSDFDYEDPEGNPILRLTKSKDEVANLNFFSNNEFYAIKENIIDTEPDIYNYNFAGYTGQFVIDVNNNIHFLKNSSGLIISIDRDNKRIEVKDLLGRLYLFEEYEYTISEPFTRAYHAQNNTSYQTSNFMETQEQITAFYLTEIVLENNKGSIYFEYENEVSSYFTKYSGTMTTTSSSGDNPCNPYFPSSNNPLYWRQYSNHANQGLKY